MAMVYSMQDIVFHASWPSSKSKDLIFPTYPKDVVSLTFNSQLGVCTASRSEQIKVDKMLDIVTKDNEKGREALHKFRFRIMERNIEVEEQRELSQLPEDEIKVHVISRTWLQTWGHWLHGKLISYLMNQVTDRNLLTKYETLRWCCT